MAHYKGRLYCSLTDDGTVNGNRDMNVDGSGTPKVFWRSPEAGSIWLVRSVFVVVVDKANFSANKFGGLPALANGCKLELEDTTDGSKFSPMEDQRFKANTDWMKLCHTVDVYRQGSGDRALRAICTLDADDDPGCYIHQDDKVVFTVQDNLTGLSYFRIMLRGKRLPSMMV